MCKPTSLVHELFPSRHEKLELPCMNDHISRKLNRKIRRLSYTFNMRSNLIIRVQSPEAVTIRTFRWFLIEHVPLRVKLSTLHRYGPIETETKKAGAIQRGEEHVRKATRDLHIFVLRTDIRTTPAPRARRTPSPGFAIFGFFSGSL